MRLLQKLSGGAKTAKTLAVPRSITMFQGCVRHQVPGELIKQLHFNDLYLLLLTLDIDAAKERLRMQAQKRMQDKGIGDVREISGNDAIKFLKGGTT